MVNEMLHINTNRYDPTHTLTLRNAFVRDMHRRFKNLVNVVYTSVFEMDVFGLKNDNLTAFQELNPARNNEFNFPSSAQKKAAFMRWLRSQVNRGLLETTIIQQVGEAVDNAWTNTYIYDSYKRGVIRARSELRKSVALNIPTISETGGVAASLSTPFHIDRLGLLYSRTFSDLEGITNAMDTQVSRILAQGLGDGDNPRLLARKLVSTINGVHGKELGITDTLGRYIPAKRRAEMLARTEIIRAHAEGTLQEYKNWGVEGVEVVAEFITAGFNVCPECSALEGRTYKIEEASGVIPVHPRCRCSWIPKSIQK